MQMLRTKRQKNFMVTDDRQYMMCRQPAAQQVRGTGGVERKHSRSRQSKSSVSKSGMIALSMLKLSYRDTHSVSKTTGGLCSSGLHAASGTGFNRLLQKSASISNVTGLGEGEGEGWASGVTFSSLVGSIWNPSHPTTGTPAAKAGGCCSETSAQGTPPLNRQAAAVESSSWKKAASNSDYKEEE